MCTLLQMLLREAYVCMGQATTTDTEAWVSQAKQSLHTNVTSSTYARPISALSTSHSLRTASRARPPSARSMPPSTQPDSGVYNAGLTSSLYSDYQSILSSVSYTPDTLDDIPLGGDLFDPGPQPPKLPRPSDEMCALAPKRKSRLAFAPPPPNPQAGDKTESVCSDDGIGSDHLDSDMSLEDIYYDGKSMVVNTIDQLGDIIVATILRSAVATVSGRSLDVINKHSEVAKLMSGSRQFGDLSARDLRELDIKLDKRYKFRPEVIGPEDDVKSTILGDKSDDEDSVLNSDDDYEDERDDFFRKRKKVRVCHSVCACL